MKKPNKIKPIIENENCHYCKFDRETERVTLENTDNYHFNILTHTICNFVTLKKEDFLFIEKLDREKLLEIIRLYNNNIFVINDIILVEDESNMNDKK